MSNLYDEDVTTCAQSEKRELQSRMCVLMTHLVKWAYQPGRRGHSWDNTIREQRAAIGRDIAKFPSHASLLGDPEWLAGAFSRARAATFAETCQPALPPQLPWTLAQLMDADFWPEEP